MISTFYFERKLVALKFWLFTNIEVAASNTKKWALWDASGVLLRFTKPLPPFDEFWGKYKINFLHPDNIDIKWV